MSQACDFLGVGEPGCGFDGCFAERFLFGGIDPSFEIPTRRRAIRLNQEGSMPPKCKIVLLV
jgi:hypothetical protein